LSTVGRTSFWPEPFLLFFLAKRFAPSSLFFFRRFLLQMFLPIPCCSTFLPVPWLYFFLSWYCVRSPRNSNLTPPPSRPLHVGCDFGIVLSTAFFLICPVFFAPSQSQWCFKSPFRTVIKSFSFFPKRRGADYRSSSPSLLSLSPAFRPAHRNGSLSRPFSQRLLSPLLFQL